MRLTRIARENAPATAAGLVALILAFGPVSGGHKRYLDWALDDPAGQGVETVRPIREEIERRVRDLLAGLLHR